MRERKNMKKTQVKRKIFAIAIIAIISTIVVSATVSTNFFTVSEETHMDARINLDIDGGDCTSWKLPQPMVAGSAKYMIIQITNHGDPLDVEATFHIDFEGDNDGDTDWEVFDEAGIDIAIAKLEMCHTRAYISSNENLYGWLVTKTGITSSSNEEPVLWDETQTEVKNGVLWSTETCPGGAQWFVMKVVTGPLLASGDYRFTLTVEPAEPIFGAMTFTTTGTTSIADGTYSCADTEGFNVYAKNGAMAMYGGVPYAHGNVFDHDAYTTVGGWGSWYNPDCADYEHYQLTISGTGSLWALEYVSGETATCAPMSGTISGTYALETGVGAYYSLTPQPTAESAGYALSNSWTVGDGTQAWDMDWSWGSEYIPLQYPGFDITYSGGIITLTPAPQ